MARQSTKKPDQIEHLLQELDEVTARVQLLERALTRNQRLSTLGTLAAGVAHELNNILTPPANYARLALRDLDDHELTAKALERVIHSCDRASRVIETVLGFARGSSDEQPCLVAEAARVAHDCALAHPEGSQITIEREIEPGLRVAMPASQLEQVLLNLLLNAIKAIGSSPGTIRVRAECSTWNNGSGDARVVRIVVEDSGPGVAEEIRASLFEPFVTADRSGVAGQGTGLGLAICEQLVREGGGSIALEDTHLGGACFVVILPIVS